MERYDLPYPIRKRSSGWEVVMVDEGDVAYVLCDSQEDAKVVADARPLIGIFMNCGRAAIPRVQRCVDMLNRHGLDARTLRVRQLMSLGN